MDTYKDAILLNDLCNQAPPGQHSLTVELTTP